MIQLLFHIETRNGLIHYADAKNYDEIKKNLEELNSELSTISHEMFVLQCYLGLRTHVRLASYLLEIVSVQKHMFFPEYYH